MNTEIQKKLTQLAYERSKPFCYTCYREAPTSVCKTCGSDDLMRLLPEVGCEYGTDWIIEHILRTELNSVDLDATFEESIRGCYPETITVGWLELDTITVLKEMDPISWKCALSDWESNEADEGSIISFDNGCTYYWTSDLESI